MCFIEKVSILFKYRFNEQKPYKFLQKVLGFRPKPFLSNLNFKVNLKYAKNLQTWKAFTSLVRKALACISNLANFSWVRMGNMTNLFIKTKQEIETEFC